MIQRRCNEVAVAYNHLYEHFSFLFQLNKKFLDQIFFSHRILHFLWILGRGGFYVPGHLFPSKLLLSLLLRLPKLVIDVTNEDYDL